MASLPPFSPGALISDGEPVNANVTNRPIQPLVNRMYEVVDYNEVVVTGNYTVQQNKDVMIYVNNSSSVTITLPLAQNQFIHKRIRIRKVSFNTEPVTIQCASGNTIDNLYFPVTSPSTTSFVLYFPSMEIELEPQGTIWRLNLVNANFSTTIFQAAHNSIISINTNSSAIDFNNSQYIYNPLNLYNTTTNLYTSLMPGRYLVSLWIGANTNIMIEPLVRNTSTNNFESLGWADAELHSSNFLRSISFQVYIPVGYNALRVVIRTVTGTGNYSNRRLHISYLGP